MKVLIDMVHPADVHFFRHAIALLQARGHEVAITARARKDVLLTLLDGVGLPYTVVSTMGRGLWGLGRELLIRDARLWSFCRRFRPDVLTGVSGMSAAQVGWLLRKPSVVWDDTEHQKLTHRITVPFATEYQCPRCYEKQLGPKQRFYNGFQELAYLRPEYFQPQPERVRELGIDPDRPYVIIRLVSWGAHHDLGQHGLSAERQEAFVKEIARYATPYITAEGTLPESLLPYQLRIPVEAIHHVLAFARLCIAEGATVASEACVLGVPAIYANTLGLGYINLLEQQGLLFQLLDMDEALERAVSILRGDTPLEPFQQARQRLLDETVDVTGHIVETLERVAGGG